jgi:hypothetical protein
MNELRIILTKGYKTLYDSKDLSVLDVRGVWYIVKDGSIEQVDFNKSGLFGLIFVVLIMLLYKTNTISTNLNTVVEQMYKNYYSNPLGA